MAANSSDMRQRLLPADTSIQLVGNGSNGYQGQNVAATTFTKSTKAKTGTFKNNKMLSRTIRKGGRFYVADFYFYLLSLPFHQLVPTLLGYFLLVSLIFGSLYYAVPGYLAIDGKPTSSFYDHFYVGMAVMADVDAGVTFEGVGKQLLHMAEGIAQLVSLAILIGVVVDRVTQAHARIVFAKKAIIGWFNRKPCFQFRVALERDGIFLEPEVQAYVMQQYKTAEGQTGRRMVELDLSTSKLSLFWLSWNVRHIIDETSPLFPFLSHLGFDDSLVRVACGKSCRSQENIPLTPEDLEIIIYFKAEDATQHETVRVLHAYSWNEIELNAQYVDIIERGEDAKGRIVTLSLDKVHQMVPIEPPSLAELQNGIGYLDSESIAVSVLGSHAPQPIAAAPHQPVAPGNPLTSPASAMHGLFFSPVPQNVV